MSEANWNATDRILYGVMCSGIALWAIATFIEACRSRPKVQMLVLSVRPPAVKENHETLSAAE